MSEKKSFHSSVCALLLNSAAVVMILWPQQQQLLCHPRLPMVVSAGAGMFPARHSQCFPCSKRKEESNEARHLNANQKRVLFKNEVKLACVMRFGLSFLRHTLVKQCHLHSHHRWRLLATLSGGCSLCVCHQDRCRWHPSPQPLLPLEGDNYLGTGPSLCWQIGPLP